MMDPRLITLIADEINVPVDAIANHSGPETGDLENWDSFTHVTLMLRIEQEFEVKFTTDEIGSLTTPQKIFDALKEKGAL
jgi:acyl carrier protein